MGIGMGDGNWDRSWNWDGGWNWDRSWLGGSRAPGTSILLGTIPEGHSPAAGGTNNRKPELKVKFGPFGNAEYRGKE